jgi:hypothetical protein
MPSTWAYGFLSLLCRACSLVLEYAGRDADLDRFLLDHYGPVALDWGVAGPRTAPINPAPAPRTPVSRPPLPSRHDSDGPSRQPVASAAMGRPKGIAGSWRPEEDMDLSRLEWAMTPRQTGESHTHGSSTVFSLTFLKP